MSEVMRLSLDLEFPFQYREDAEGNLCYYSDYATLKAERDALAAENAALVAAFTESVTTDATDVFSDTVVINHDWDESGSWSYVDNETEVIRAVLDVIRPVTPATDAYLNSVRAEGVEAFAHHQRVIADSLSGAVQRSHRITACRAEDFAAQLRAGEPS